MIARDVNDQFEHEPLFLFTDNKNGIVYLVREPNYDKFIGASSDITRENLADIVLDVRLKTVEKCRSVYPSWVNRGV